MAIGIVDTKFGKLQGIEEEGVMVFKGVPYAAPPVGELRWKPPVDPKPWEGVRVCNTYGPRPMQMLYTGLSFEPWQSDFYYMGYPQCSEDCLYLNIATDAQNEGEKRPVFIWYHGGGLGSGYSYEIEFNPTMLAKKGIIVVTVGQRLNVFGYLALPQLSEEQGGISGNYGLMDEVKALEWIYDNIAAFGGDPENITIGGQSGGTWKTGALVTCPKAEGKIRRVINQSSLCWTKKYATVSEGEKEGMAYIETLGFAKDASLEELRAADASVFCHAPGDVDTIKRIPGSMYYDGVWVPEEDLTVSNDKYAGKCDYLIGGNYGECTVKPGLVLGGPGPQTAEEFYADVKTLIGEELYDKYDVEELFKTTDAEADHYSKRLAVEGLTGFAGGMRDRYFGARRAKKFPEVKTYSYVFSHVTPGRPEDVGTVRDPDLLLAWHSSELFYTFGSLRENVPPCRPWTELDFKLADQISSYWANFIKSGDPNGEGLPFWPASDENYGWMDLGDEPVSHVGLNGKKDALLIELIKRNQGVPDIE